MGLFGNKGSSPSRTTTHRFVYKFHVAALGPWPAGYGPLAIEWERGSKRRGRTSAASPEPLYLNGEGPPPVSYPFDASFKVPCTLYQAIDKNTGEAIVQKKALLLNVAAATSKSGRSSAKDRLGAAVLNLADFCAGQVEFRIDVPVACSKMITTAAGGQPTLEITIRRLEKGSGMGDDDDASSMFGSQSMTSESTATGSMIGSRRGNHSRAVSVDSTMLVSNPAYLGASQPSLGSAQSSLGRGQGGLRGNGSSLGGSSSLSRLNGAGSGPLAGSSSGGSYGPALTKTRSHGALPGAVRAEPSVIDEDGFIVDDSDAPPSNASYASSYRTSHTGGRREDAESVFQPDSAPSTLGGRPPSGHRRAVSLGDALQPIPSGLPFQDAASLDSINSTPVSSRWRRAGHSRNSSFASVVSESAQPLQDEPFSDSQGLGPRASSAGSGSVSGMKTAGASSAAAAAAAGGSSNAGANRDATVGDAGRPPPSPQQQQQQGQPPSGRKWRRPGIVLDELVPEQAREADASQQARGRADPEQRGEQQQPRGQQAVEVDEDGFINDDDEEVSRKSRAVSGDTSTAAESPLEAARVSRPAAGPMPSNMSSPTNPDSPEFSVADRIRSFRGMKASPSSPPGKGGGVATGKAPGGIAATPGQAGKHGISKQTGTAVLTSSPGADRGGSASESSSPVGQVPQGLRLGFRSPRSPIPGTKSPGSEECSPASYATAVAGRGDEDGVEVVLQELRTAAAIEASVHLVRRRAAARMRTGAQASQAAAYAPARRLARTIITLGPEEGVLFGLKALRALEAEARGSLSPSGMGAAAFWWSNCVLLRWMLWAVCGGGTACSPGTASSELLGNFKDMLAAMAPPLRALESRIFNGAVNALWKQVVLPAAATATLADARRAKGRPQLSSQSELAASRWRVGLQAAADAMRPMRTAEASGSLTSAAHIRLLREGLLAALLVRLDAALMRELASDTAGSGVRHLPPQLLPFKMGPLTFGEGVSLKIALASWQDWARDQGIKDGGSTGHGFPLFSKLRAAADLLMFPKDMLAHEQARADMLPGLSPHEVVDVLSKFVPDDFAPDSMPRGLLAKLKAEAGPRPPPLADDSDGMLSPGPGHGCSPPSEANGSSPGGTLQAAGSGTAVLCPRGQYEPISEAVLLEKGLVQSVSLDMDDQSDGELEAMEKLYELPNALPGDAPIRFRLLRDLWASAR